MIERQEAERLTIKTLAPAASVVAVNPVVPTGRQLVGDVMTRSVVTARADALFKEIVLAMTRNRISSVPVVDDDGHVLGVVTASDLLARLSGEHGRAPRGHRLAAAHETSVKSRGLTAGELMTRPAVTVGEYDTVGDAAITAASGRVRCLPVVDDDGVLVGITTKSDLVKVFLRDDEAIRLDISDGIVAEVMLLEPGTVEVEVVEGVVTLTGELHRRLLELQLLELVRAVPGVVAVDNRLTYKIDDTVVPWAWTSSPQHR